MYVAVGYQILLGQYIVVGTALTYANQQACSNCMKIRDENKQFLPALGGDSVTNKWRDLPAHSSMCLKLFCAQSTKKGIPVHFKECPC